MTDIDAVWVFDLKTKEGKKLELPGIQFANDPTVMNGALYVSDNRSDQLFRVEPADFLKSKAAPKITVVFKGKGVFPNGLYPGKNGVLFMVGFELRKSCTASIRWRPARSQLCSPTISACSTASTR